MVWNDLNGNGYQDVGEPGLAGWTVTLHAPFQPDQIAVTDPNGRYSFSGLTAGTYTLSTVAPAGWNLVTPALGTLTETVSAGASVGNANFGYQIRPTIFSQNYAVLFSGALDPEENFTRYYNNVKSLYKVLITDVGLNPANVYILYADANGAQNIADDQNIGSDPKNHDIWRFGYDIRGSAFHG